MAAFYRDRAYEPFWTGDEPEARARLEALLSAMGDASVHGLGQARFDPDRLINRLKGPKGPTEHGRLDVEVTRTFLAYAAAHTSGVTRPRDIDPITMPRDVAGPGEAELLAAMEERDPRAVLRDLVPDSAEYGHLLRHRMRLAGVVAAGGWGAQIPVERLEPGDVGPAVVALRDRLRAQGFLSPTPTAAYDERIAAAVSEAQEAMGLPIDGIAGPRTIAALNVSALRRLEQVTVAMERERWMPEERGAGREIWVNLPAFETVVLDDGVETFRTVSVIGRAEDGRYTPEFSDRMDHMVINPTWFVPRTIAVRDYLPRLRANPYAASYMRILDRNGREVNRARGFSQYTARTFPFSMRQPPGPRNALGLVKFMFPNQHAIYLHDSPAKQLYDEEVRAFSSGCIRLKEPFEFAYHLLARQSEDPEGLFQRILRSGKERRVDLAEEIPVHLVYRTAFTDARGVLHFRDDIYGRDAKVLAALRDAGVRIGADSALELAALEN
ncbi:MAG: L,D-transpeptidase family protein [Shimia sp.]